MKGFRELIVELHDSLIEANVNDEQFDIIWAAINSVHSQIKPSEKEVDSTDEIKLSETLSNFHKFIIENKYTKEIHDSNLVAFEFMSMDYDEQQVKKNPQK